MNNKYFLLRHGKTIYQTSKKRITYPRFDSSKIGLTKESKKKIKKLAQEIRTLGIDLIYSSDFFRTRQTAGIIAKELGKKIIFDKRLRDINMGIYHSRPKKEFYQDFPWIFPLRFIKRPFRGESWKDCQKRIFGFFKEIDKKYKGKTILIVSHGDPLWLLEGTVKKWPLKNFIKTSAPNYIQPGELRKL